MESVDYGDTDLHSIIEGDRYSNRKMRILRRIRIR